ncbi:hypothetical protein [Microbulbifer sp. Q7]|uniref:hypothetical protein n=1 Tax=Microbulbifer sp. Q7 TaxID=1785091 RepID=UPI000AD21E54|nr:hypothetical protein [Microbulbifer sp. Q7]
MDKIIIKPWIGNSYGEKKILPMRTLILGESNYTSEDNFDSDLVVRCVTEHIGSNCDKNFSRFATKIRRVALGRDTKVSPSEFWNSVAFYNFVQFLVGNASKNRPTDLVWSNSIEAFESLVSMIYPERILVLGVENWKNLLSKIAHSVIDEHSVLLKVNNFEVTAGYISHPSNGGGFSYNKWLPVAQSLLKT